MLPASPHALPGVPNCKVSVNVSRDSLLDLKRRICEANGVVFNDAWSAGAVAQPSAEGEHDECAAEAMRGEPEHYTWRGCMCRKAAERHGVAPAECCLPCDSAVVARSGLDTCAICRVALSESLTPSEGEAAKESAAAVSVSVGACGCALHTRCIERWLRGGQDGGGTGTSSEGVPPLGVRTMQIFVKVRRDLLRLCVSMPPLTLALPRPRRPRRTDADREDHHARHLGVRQRRRSQTQSGGKDTSARCPAAAHLRGQAAGGWPQSDELRHPEGVHAAPGAAPGRGGTG